MNLEQNVISSASGEYSRNTWYRSGPKDKPHPLCVFLDGEHYHRDMDAMLVIEDLLATGVIPPVSLLFVSHVSSVAAEADYACRQADFACNNRYSKFIAEDVVGWARERNPSTQSRGNVICGLSLSGLASAYLAFCYPEVFSAALCQSGSFWWLHGRETPWSPTKAKFWLSVGDRETATGVSHSKDLYQEISQIAGVEAAAKEFNALGGTVNYHQYPGGHAPAPWRAELPPALKWLMEFPRP